MEQPLTFRDPHGHKVSAVLSSPAGVADRLVVLCHGFLSDKNSTTNRALTSLLGERGMGTLRFDFFGHGESEGPFECITTTLAVTQASAALEWAAARGSRRLGLIGSSFGGLVAILVASRFSSPNAVLACLGLKCPVPDFPEILRLEFGQAGITQWNRTGEIPNVTGGAEPIRLRFDFYEDCLAHDGYKAAEAIRAPVLIVQGDRDEYVPLHQSRRLDEAVRTEKRLAILPGADHRLTRPDDFRTMTRLLADWMTVYLKT